MKRARRYFPVVDLRTFAEREIRAAHDHAMAGGMALHLMAGHWANLRPDTPKVFKNRAEIAHLFDQDRERLERAARYLGVRVIKVERLGLEGQHIDLCAGPLERAKAIAEKQAIERANAAAQGTLSL